MKKLLLTTAFAVTSFSAFSADSVDISVIGTISANSCTPASSGGGVVDYGFIKQDMLAETGPTILPVKTVAFSINCSGPMNVALRAYSNRPGTVTDAGVENIAGTGVVNSDVKNAGLNKDMPIGNSGYGSPTAAGLGQSKGKNIGGYTLTLPPVSVSLDDQEATYKYYSYEMPSDAKWVKESASYGSNNGHSLFSKDVAYYAYSAPR